MYDVNRTRKIVVLKVELTQLMIMWVLDPYHQDEVNPKVTTYFVTLCDDYDGCGTKH